ncbi:hypothetical protein M405DRAFT_870842 [Rhizopogon salebrosus TDB-379]|nr:hypothetical protein M405DRAFT_870842 [Rhizopogon salebrosus TDB-379]
MTSGSRIHPYILPSPSGSAFNSQYLDNHQQHVYPCGCLHSDATFFVLNFLGLEAFIFDKGLMHRRCFPYATNYPFSHSLLGMAVLGVILATAYMFMSERKVSAKDEAILLAVTLTHFLLLEVPSHREDVKITPRDSTHLGAGMFEYPLAQFFTECALFLGALWMYTTFAPIATRAGYKRHEARLWGITASLLAWQVHFCFGTVPTLETRWVHAPMFLSEILMDSWLIGRLEA